MSTILQQFENDQITIKDVIDTLIQADDLYFNDGESPLTDSEYDTIRQLAQYYAPDDPYFKRTGAPSQREKVKLPYQMGSLDQIEIGQITNWIGDWSLQHHTIVISDKLDGASALIQYSSDGSLDQGFSKGDGLEGQPWTAHLMRIPSVPKKIDGTLKAVRGEVIISKSNWEIIRHIIKTTNGKLYKNSRNCISGLMNALTIHSQQAYDLIDFVAYEVVDYYEETTNVSKAQMLDDLQDNKFKIPHFISEAGSALTDVILADIIQNRRQQSPYEIDGIVLDVNAGYKRHMMSPSRDTLNPAYSIKYKVMDASNLVDTKVVDVELNVSKHGYIKPTILFEPVVLEGAELSRCTGFNMSFIEDNNIGPDAVIQITRSGGVIPYCINVIKPMMNHQQWFDSKLDAIGQWKWNENRVDVMLIDGQDNSEVIIQQTIDFFSSLNVPSLKEGNVRKMFWTYTYTSITNALQHMITCDQQVWINTIGENGRKIYAGLRDKLGSIPLYELAGATSYFGRGVGKRKFKKLLAAIPIGSLKQFQQLTTDQIVRVGSFDFVTADKIVKGIEQFVAFVLLTELEDHIVFQQNVASGPLEGQKIVVTGFRDKQLAVEIEAKGGENSSSVSGKTTLVIAKDPNSNSGKLKKARDLGIEIVSVEQFRNRYL